MPVVCGGGGACLVGAAGGAWYGWTHSERSTRWKNAAGDGIVGCAVTTAGAAAAIIGGAAVVAAVGADVAVAATATTDVVAVIGRMADTKPLQDVPGYEVLNRLDWTTDVNDEWVQSVIDRGMKVLMASPDTPENLVNKKTVELSQFSIEIIQFLMAGYTKVGSYLIPPGGTP